MKRQDNRMEAKSSILNGVTQKEIFILVLCIIVGFALRFYTFDKKSLWIDEVYTFNDSRDGFKDQLEFYKENPTYLHPPLFYILTHLFYPFTRPERDLRIIPLVFGTLSIPMIYFLSKSFLASIALPCTLSLTFMTYHISLSQDGRSYSLLMFLGMVGLYFFLKHLKTLKKGYLVPVAISYAALFHSSYSSIPFIILSQVIWFYRIDENNKRMSISSPLILNGLLILLCLPWTFFIALNYKGQGLMDPIQSKVHISFWGILYGVLHDWAPHMPLIILSVILFILLPFFLRSKQNALILLALFLLPAGGLYLLCKLLNITHFVTSRYFINFLPFFFIATFLSLNSIELKFQSLKRFIRPRFLFMILLILSHLMILPLYYRSEKQDFRGLVTYLKTHLQPGDNIFAWELGYMPGILHYFGVYPEDRHYHIPFKRVSEEEIQFRKSFVYQNNVFTIYVSKDCCAQYITKGNQIWVAVGKSRAIKMKENCHFILKGYFDGSFLNFDKFPVDASIYLFLFDPKCSENEGINLPIENNSY
jgi:hypothetical protein